MDIDQDYQFTEIQQYHQIPDQQDFDWNENVSAPDSNAAQTNGHDLDPDIDWILLHGESIEQFLTAPIHEDLVDSYMSLLDTNISDYIDPEVEGFYYPVDGVDQQLTPTQVSPSANFESLELQPYSVKSRKLKPTWNVYKCDMEGYVSTSCNLRKNF